MFLAFELLPVLGDLVLMFAAIEPLTAGSLLTRLAFAFDPYILEVLLILPLGEYNLFCEDEDFLAELLEVADFTLGDCCLFLSDVY